MYVLYVHFQIIFRLFQSAVDLDTILTAAHQSYKNIELKTQPIPVIVGPQHKIAACYVVVNNYAYEVSSVLQAIDLTFKMFYCLDCKYPPNAYSLWMLLQKAFYDINIHGDKVSITLNAIIGEIIQTLNEKR